MYALSKSILWPCSLLVPEADEMVIRASTRLYSRLSFHSGMPGRRLPMLSTAAGRAYFSNVSDDERQMLLSMLRNREDRHVAMANDPKFLGTMVKQTVSQGYAMNVGEWDDEPKFGGIAMPIYASGEVQAVLNIIFLNRAVKEQGAIPKLVEALKACVQRIEGHLTNQA
jgi:IclR family mhp operon transcriptional activator